MSTRTPTHVILSRVWAPSRQKLIHHIILIDIANFPSNFPTGVPPSPPTDPPPDMLVADNAMIAQEYHSIHFPRRNKALKKEDEPPRVHESVFLRTLADMPQSPQAPDPTMPPWMPIQNFEYYNEILDNTPTKIWSVDRHPPAFGIIHVAYKISWQGVDIILTPAVKGRGKNAAPHMDKTTATYQDLHSPEHKDPKFRYHNNKIQNLWEDQYTFGWELFRGKVIYNGSYVPGDGLNLGTDDWNEGWSGWRLNRKNGEQKRKNLAPDWYREGAAADRDDALIWKALQVEEHRLKWKGGDTNV
ncbi:hypothetical protein V8F33_007912 [Rhypophila sp. PSN 637]